MSSKEEDSGGGVKVTKHWCELHTAVGGAKAGKGPRPIIWQKRCQNRKRHRFGRPPTKIFYKLDTLETFKNFLKFQSIRFVNKWNFLKIDEMI